MPTKLITKYSSTGGTKPASNDLDVGELGVNVTDRRLFTKNTSGAIVTVVGEVANVKDFGAVGDGTADDTVAIQAAADFAGRVYFPEGKYKCGQVNITTRGAQFIGEGKNLTAIIPTNQSGDRSIFVIENEKITISGFWFRPATYVKGVQDVNNTARCIRVKKASNVNSPVTWVDISDNVFENIRGAAITMDTPMRESNVKQNNFIGMGNPSTSEGIIQGATSVNFSDNINNLLIADNTFYRGATPFINLPAVDNADPSKKFYNSLWIERNLFHGQRLDTSTGGSGVISEPTNQLYIRNCSRVRIRNNTFTSFHGDYSGIYIDSLLTDEANDDVTITDNSFAVDNNGSYTGIAVFMKDCTTNTVMANNFKTGFQTYDIRVRDSGAFSITPRVLVINNTPTNAGGPVGVLLPSTPYTIGLQDEEYKQLTKLTAADLEATTKVLTTDLKLGRSGSFNMSIGTGQYNVDYTDLGLADLGTTSYTISLSTNANVPVFWGSKTTTGFTVNRSSTAAAQQVDWQVNVET
jgi:hypothetical protein